MPTWLRWGKGSRASKWHKPDEAFKSTLCGEWLSHVRYEAKETYGIPIDDHAVCLRCMRAVEMRKRKEEQQP